MRRTAVLALAPVAFIFLAYLISPPPVALLLFATPAVATLLSENPKDSAVAGLSSAVGVLIGAALLGIPVAPEPAKAVLEINGTLLKITYYPANASKPVLTRAAMNCLLSGSPKPLKYVSITNVLNGHTASCGSVPILRSRNLADFLKVSAFLIIGVIVISLLKAALE